MQDTSHAWQDVTSLAAKVGDAWMSAYEASSRDQGFYLTRLKAYEAPAIGATVRASLRTRGNRRRVHLEMMVRLSRRQTLTGLQVEAYYQATASCATTGKHYLVKTYANPLGPLPEQLSAFAPAMTATLLALPELSPAAFAQLVDAQFSL